MDVTAWEMAPRDELPALRQRRLDSFLTFLGPAGFATPDDLEALESCQQGFSQRRRRMERHLPRHGPRPAGERRGADARVLAAMAAADGRRGLQGGPMIRTAPTAAETGHAARGQADRRQSRSQPRSGFGDPRPDRGLPLPGGTAARRLGSRTPGSRSGPRKAHGTWCRATTTRTAIQPATWC